MKYVVSAMLWWCWKRLQRGRVCVSGTGLYTQASSVHEYVCVSRGVGRRGASCEWGTGGYARYGLFGSEVTFTEIQNENLHSVTTRLACPAFIQ